MKKRIYPDNAFREVPEKYFGECDKGGKTERFVYTTRDNLTSGSPDFEKYAIVYLPYGYDNSGGTGYNVLYLMHGGGDTPEWFFGGEGENTPLKNVIDNMINSGETEPLIICAVSYYTEYSNDPAKNCIDFHCELMTDIIPKFEKEYHTYAADSVSADSLKSSRPHRAFGGFSMGACAAWSVFEHCLDTFGYFLPISGDCWAKGEKQGRLAAGLLSEKVKEHGMTSEDFIIYSGCGENDIAEPNLTPQIEAMKKFSDTFIYCDNFADGNLYQCVYKTGGHDRDTVIRIMYNGLPKMFG